jgi:hypothetical protein
MCCVWYPHAFHAYRDQSSSTVGCQLTMYCCCIHGGIPARREAASVYATHWRWPLMLAGTWCPGSMLSAALATACCNSGWGLLMSMPMCCMAFSRLAWHVLPCPPSGVGPGCHEIGHVSRASLWPATPGARMRLFSFDLLWHCTC